MTTRLIALVSLIALTGIALDGAPATEDIALPTLVEPAAADTCEGWPQPIPKVLDECPHGPTP